MPRLEAVQSDRCCGRYSILPHLVGRFQGPRGLMNKSIRLVPCAIAFWPSLALVCLDCVVQASFCPFSIRGHFPKFCERRSTAPERPRTGLYEGGRRLKPAILAKFLDQHLNSAINATCSTRQNGPFLAATGNSPPQGTSPFGVLC